MKFTQDRVTVSTTATAVIAAGSSGSFLVINRGSTSVFFGDSAVTTSDGVEVETGESFPVVVTGSKELDDGLFGIVAAGTEPVHVLRTG